MLDTETLTHLKELTDILETQTQTINLLVTSVSLLADRVDRLEKGA